MGIVTGQAMKGAWAFRETAALDKSHRLKFDRKRVVGIRHAGFKRRMALTAEPDHRRSVVSDRSRDEARFHFELNRVDMMASRSMTTLARDPSIRRLRPLSLKSGSIIHKMALDAFAQRIDSDRFAQAIGTLGTRRMSGRAIPARAVSVP